MLAFITIAISASARIIVSKSVDDKVIISKKHDSFRNTTLGVTGHNIVFKGLPKNTMSVYVIDAKGKAELSGTMSRKNNTLNMSQLSKGPHTIALKQGASIKVFGWLAEVVVKG